MKDKTFMLIVEYERIKRSWTVPYLCELFNIERKNYDWYRKGIKTPNPDFVLKMIRAFGVNAFM